MSGALAELELLRLRQAIRPRGDVDVDALLGVVAVPAVDLLAQASCTKDLQPTANIRQEVAFNARRFCHRQGPVS